MITQHEDTIRLIAEMLAALELVASLPGFEPKEPYAVVVLRAIHAARGEEG